MAEPWKMDWGNSAGPVYGPPPVVKPLNPLEEEAKTLDIEGKRLSNQKAARDLANPAASSENKPTATEQKGLSFYQRALDANRTYEATGVGARSIPSNAIHNIAPAVQKSILPEALGGDSIPRQVADANQLAFVNAVLRSDSGANAPEQEVDRYIQQFFPQPGETNPAVLEAKRQLRLQAIEGLKATAGPLAASEPVNQSTNLGEIAAPPQEQLAPSTDGMNTVDNPQLAGVRGEYLKRLEAGQSAGEIIPWLRQAGITDPKLLSSALQQIQFRKNNPNVPIANYNTNALDDMDVPLSATESMLNSAAQTAPGAFAMNAGQAVSLNTLDDIAGATGGNAERARLALNYAQQQHPVASTAGTIAGGVTAALGSEAALGGAGMTAGVPRALLADTAYGAGSGAGASEGNRLGGAVHGGLAGLIGSAGGQAIARGVGSAISPTGGRLADLYESGVRPTPGQRLVNSGVIGRTVNATEEGLSSVPIVGSAIRGARQQARDQFQIGAFNEALKEVGEKLPKGMKPGSAPHIYAEKVFDKVYDHARAGMRVVADEQLSGELGDLGAQVGNLAEPSMKRFFTILQNVVMRRTKGAEIAGDAYKQIQSDLGKQIRGIRKSQSGDGELADVLEELQGALDGAARRHSDPEAVALLDNADRGYAKFVRIQEAAKARGGDAGTFTPTQFDRAIQKNARGNRSQEYLKGEALMQDYADQGMNLVDRIPNSGSADRAMLGVTAAGAAGFAEPSSLTMLGALGLLYAPGVRKGLTGAMAPRGPAAKALANEVRKRARIASATGAVLGTSRDQ